MKKYLCLLLLILPFSGVGIAGGTTNMVCADHGFIGGGQFNEIAAISPYGTIVGGLQSIIDANSDHGFVGGGTTNFIASNSPISTIGGGKTNMICSAISAIIGGGNTNFIDLTADESFIGGGELNIICQTANCSAIAGGINNVVTFPMGTIFGGSNNSLLAEKTVIGGGYCNIIMANADASVILGGVFNEIRLEALNSVIGGGAENCIGNLTGGTPVSHNVIMGGWKSAIPTAEHGTILGGALHELTGNHSAVLGGYCNCDAGFKCVGLFGCEVTAVMDCAFHANNYIVSNMPVTSAIATGQLFYCIIGGVCPVFI